MLTRFDDFPLHQTVEPLAVMGTSDRNAYGRYWFNGFDPDGEFYFGAAFGVYPNREVMDCSLSIVRKDGTQDSFRASRRCPKDRTDLRVGPFKLEIQEPMRTLRITLDSNETGISADLTFHAQTVAHAEPADVIRYGNRIVMNTKRYTQFGSWGGEISVKGRRQQVDAATTVGMRDRSWGWRPLGEPEGGGTLALPPQVFWLWAPIVWKDECTHYGLFENADGSRFKSFGHIFPRHAHDSYFDTLEEEVVEEGQAGAHRLQFYPGTRFAALSEIDLPRRKGQETIKLEPLLRFYMLGIGYNHPTWGHGTWHGEEAITSDSWIVSDLDPLAPQHQHIQHVVRARRGDEIGAGVLEQALFGPHHGYGLKGAVDPLK